MILTLPLPPSINKAYRNVSPKERAAGVRRGQLVFGRRRSREYEAWIANADNYVLMQKKNIKKMTGPLTITLRLPLTMKGDITNRIKCAEDYLVSREITGDDKHNHKFTVERSDVQKHECEIEITGRE